MQQQTPPTVAAMLDGHGGAVTLTVLQKEVGQARPDLYEWLTRDGGKLPVDKGVVPVEGLEEAVAAFEEEQRLRRSSTARRTGRWSVAPGLVAPAARPRSGWHACDVVGAGRAPRARRPVVRLRAKMAVGGAFELPSARRFVGLAGAAEGARSSCWRATHAIAAVSKVAALRVPGQYASAA